MKRDRPEESVIGVTAFKAQCLALIDEVARGKTQRVVLMRHNRPVAAIVPIEHEPVELWGAMRGSVNISPGVNLTEPTGEIRQAESRRCRARSSCSIQRTLALRPSGHLELIGC
ncbi:MAG TPA: hypothetical protein VHW90_07090 [Stellaceae bacterium]|nr:hypothetical protein [Stellaceae bacterium]